MKLIRNWKRVTIFSLSNWFGGFLPLIWLAVPELLFAFFHVEMSPVFAWIVACFLALAVPVVRNIDQGGLDK